MAGFKEKYKNVPGLQFSDSGSVKKPEGYDTVSWGGYLQDAKAYYDFKKKSGVKNPLKLLKLKRKMNASKK